MMASIEYGSYIVAQCGYIASGEIAAFDSCPSADTPLAVFIEHGAIKATIALNSPRVTEVSVYVVRAFVQLRDTLIALLGPRKKRPIGFVHND